MPTDFNLTAEKKFPSRALEDQDNGTATMTRPVVARRILVLTETEPKFARIRAACGISATKHAETVHWLTHYANSHDALFRGLYDVVILDSRHRGLEILRVMARSGCETPAVVIVDEEFPSRDAAGIICEFITHQDVASGRLPAAIDAVTRRADDRRNHERATVSWRLGGANGSHAVAFPSASGSQANLYLGNGLASDAQEEFDHRDKVMVGRIDAAGRIRTIKGQTRRLLGHGASELVGCSFVELFPFSLAALQRAMAGTPASFATQLDQGTPAERTLQFNLTFDREHGSGVRFTARDTTHERDLAAQVLEAVDAERQRIGADLHDEMGQLLTGISCLSAALTERLRGENDLAADDARTISEVAKQALAHIRALARGLAPVRLVDAGLVPALEDLGVQMRRMHNVDFQLEIRGNAKALSREAGGHVFRIVQEATSNAIRHGQATSIDVTLTCENGSNHLLIADNGSGFDPAVVHEGSGSGFGLMKYRAALIGGHLEASSNARDGARIEIHFATHQNPDAHEHAC